MPVAQTLREAGAIDPDITRYLFHSQDGNRASGPAACGAARREEKMAESPMGSPKGAGMTANAAPSLTPCRVFSVCGDAARLESKNSKILRLSEDERGGMKARREIRGSGQAF